MSSPVSAPRSRGADGSGYRERLWVPWWWWPLAFGVVGLLAAEIGLGDPGLKTWLPYAILLPATALGLWRLGRIVVGVAGDELCVDDARLPVRYIRAVAPLTADQRRDLLGVQADPEAFVVQRPWVGPAIRIDLDDPADPTPYWVVSTRQPDRLAAAISAAGRTDSPAAM
jgi:hypothetical protein